MRHSTNTAIKRRYQLLSLLAIVCMWWALATILDKAYIVPSPLAVAKALGHLVGSNTFYFAMGWTLLRTLICVAISMILGMALGIGAGYFSPLRGFLAPLIRMMRTLPTIVIIVYVIIWLSGNIAPIVVTALITLPIVYSNVLEGYDAIPIELTEVFNVYQLSGASKLRSLILPAIHSYVSASVIAVSSLGLKVMISSEVLSQTQSSIGKSFQMAKIGLETDVLFAWAIVTVVLSMVIEAILKKVLIS